MDKNNQLSFIGTHYHALEQKGRLSIPKSFREKLSDTAILTQGLEKSLFLFSNTNWMKELESLQNKTFTRKASRDWIRLIANAAVEVSFDTQGRILIPTHLQTYARLEKKVVVVGSLNRIEIWDQVTYHEYFESLQKSAEDIAESLEDLGKKE